MHHHTASQRGHDMNGCIERCTSFHQVCLKPSASA